MHSGYTALRKMENVVERKSSVRRLDVKNYDVAE
jgi:hypothetical protein